MGSMMLGMAIGNSVLSAVTTFMSAEQRRTQQKAQATAMSDQAQMMRNQAQLEAQKGRVEAEAIDRQKSAIRREYEQVQGRNRSLLAAGNIDMTSGSAADVSLGNINRFADDVAENSYQRMLKQWETDQNVKTMEYNAAVQDAQASYLKKTAGNLGTSLLLSQLAGASGFFGGGGAQAIAGMSTPASNSTLWDMSAGNTISMRHPSGRWTTPRTYGG